MVDIKQVQKEIKEENVEILTLWKNAKKIKHMDLYCVMLEAFKEAHNRESGWFIDVYASGKNGAIGGARSQNTSSYCGWHGYGKYCPDCMPVHSVKGWHITDSEEIHKEDPDGNEKEGYVWDSNKDEWIEEVVVIETMCEIYAHDVFCAQHTPQDEINNMIKQCEYTEEYNKTENIKHEGERFKKQTEIYKKYCEE